MLSVLSGCGKAPDAPDATPDAEEIIEPAGEALEPETPEIPETPEPEPEAETPPEPEHTGVYEQIPQDEAKRIMDEEEGYIILDVREQSEYDEGHIPGAVVMPYTRAEELAPEMLPDTEQLILVYCRSGRRSKIAAQTLADLGYTNVKEFGGIIDWQYETE